MSPGPYLRPHTRHGLGPTNLSPIGKEEIHLDFANLLERSREQGEDFMGYVGDREGFDNVISRALLQLSQVELCKLRQYRLGSAR